MSQRSVERTIGRLVTDEGFRRRFAEDPRAAIQEIVASGLELNSCEARALAVIDQQRLAQLAEAIHPYLQKIDGGLSS